MTKVLSCGSDYSPDTEMHAGLVVVQRPHVYCLCRLLCAPDSILPEEHRGTHKRVNTAPSLSPGRGGQALLGHSLFPGVTGSASYSYSGDTAIVLSEAQSQEKCIREPSVLSGDLGQRAMPKHMFGHTARTRRFCPRTMSLSLPEGLLQA